MENKFECGNEALLRVTVCAVYNEGSVYDYDVSYKNHDTGEDELIPVIEEQLTTASQAPNIDWQAKYNEYNEKAEAKIRELANKLNEMAESLREAQAKAVSLNSALKAQIAANTELEGINDELDKKDAELSVLVDKLRKEIAQREELWGNVSNNNDIAKVNLNRLCKQREILTDRIIALEAELEAERKKNYG